MATAKPKQRKGAWAWVVGGLLYEQRFRDRAKLAILCALAGAAVVRWRVPQMAAWLHSCRTLLLAAAAAAAARAAHGVWRAHMHPVPFSDDIVGAFDEAAAPRAGVGGGVGVGVGVGGGAPPWWSDPPAVTEAEMELLRFFSRITWRLGGDPESGGAAARLARWRGAWGAARRAGGTWGMVGGGKAGGTQLGFTSIRYHVAFVAYAVALVGSRTPAFQGLQRRTLGACLAMLLQYEVWSYCKTYWRGQEARPFECGENIMWTGHVLQTAVLYEALLGDARLRRRGGLVARDGASGEQHASGTLGLGRRIARAMRENPTGGVACEPGCVFWPCQNHPHVALVMLEALLSEGGDVGGGGAAAHAPRCASGHAMAVADYRGGAYAGGWHCDQCGKGGRALGTDERWFCRECSTDTCFECHPRPGDGDGAEVTWGAERERFERWALSSMRAPVRTGAIQMVHLQHVGPRGLGLAFGHAGMDGWALSWYAPWARSLEAVRRMWFGVARELVPWQLLGGVDDAVDAAAAAAAPAAAPSSDEAAEVARRRAAVPEASSAAPPSVCCATVNIPTSTWAASLYPLAVQVADGGAARAIRTWLEAHFVRRGGGGGAEAVTPEPVGGRAGAGGAGERHDEPLPAGCARVREGVEWAVGSSANYLLGLALEAGGAGRLRDTTWQPLPRAYFRGPLVHEVLPTTTDVYRAFRRRNDSEIVLELRPAGAVGARVVVEVLLRNVPSGGVAAVRAEPVAAPAAAPAAAAAAAAAAAPEWALLSAAELTAACARAATACAPAADVREGGLPAPPSSEFTGLRLVLPAGERSAVTICFGARAGAAL